MAFNSRNLKTAKSSSIYFKFWEAEFTSPIQSLKELLFFALLISFSRLFQISEICVKNGQRILIWIFPLRFGTKSENRSEFSRGIDSILRISAWSLKSQVPSWQDLPSLVPNRAFNFLKKNKVSDPICFKTFSN